MSMDPRFYAPDAKPVDMVAPHTDEEIIETVQEMCELMLREMDPGDWFRIERCDRSDGPMFKLTTAALPTRTPHTEAGVCYRAQCSSCHKPLDQDGAEWMLTAQEAVDEAILTAEWVRAEDGSLLCEHCRGDL